MKTKIICEKTTVEAGCGLGYAMYFDSINDNADDAGWAYPDEAPGDKSQGGTGFELACFVHEPECRLAYVAMKKTKRVVYQSPVRVNINSGRPFFFTVFDDKKDKNAKKEAPSKRTRWPFGEAK